MNRFLCAVLFFTALVLWGGAANLAEANEPPAAELEFPKLELLVESKLELSLEGLDGAIVS